MKKYILLILTLLFVSIFTISSFAINMNLSEEESSTESDNSEIIEAIIDDSNQIEQTNNIENITENDTPTSLVSRDSTNQNFFTVENIINVILIAVGIVLIFLGIAILIRLK